MQTLKESPHEGGRQSDCGRHFTTPPIDPPDFEQASHFLTLLDETAERWTFQTFDDNKDRKNPDLTRILHGTLEEHWEELCRLSALGAGVFMVVNETNGKGRKTADIIRVRAVFRELDRAGARPLPPGIEPHLVVESSPGKYHEYLLIDGGNRFDRFEGVMQRLVDDYDSDPAAKDRSRVLRLPGFPHQKNPAKPWRVRLYAEGGHQPYTWDQVTAALPPKKRARTASKIPSGTGLEDLDLIRSALATIPPDCEYQPWLSVGMALHYASGGGMKGFTLWDDWSAQGDSYRDGVTRYKWGTFGHYTGSPATLGTLFHLAQEYGWKRGRSNGHDDKPPHDYSDYPEAHESHQAPAISSNFSNFSNFSNAGWINSENALSPADPWLDPQPLRRELPPPEPFPIDALGDKIASAVREVQRIVKAPEALCGSEFLAAAALTVQPRADIVLDGRVIPLVLFFLMLGVSGERKSAIDRIALDSVAYLQKELRQKYERALADYEIEIAAWKKSTEEANSAKQKGRDAKIEALRAVGPKPEPPINRGLVINHAARKSGFISMPRGR